MIPTRDAGLKLLVSPPVFDALYKECGPGTLCRVAKTCNGARQAVDNYLRHTLNFTKRMARFFGDDALDFRRLQAQLQFLVSGSQALQLLERTVYPKSDLDIYVFPLDADPVGRWLIAHGYEFSSWQDDNESFDAALAHMPDLWELATQENREERQQYGIPGVRDVFNFKKRGDDDDTVLQVQIIVADLAPVEAVLNFHATMVMNFVAWDRAYSLYPQGTFEQRRALVTYDQGRHFDRAMVKYAARGFRIDTHLFDAESTHGPFRFGARWVGDAHCWVVPLDTAGIDPPAVPVALEANSWELGRHATHHRAHTFGPCAIRTVPLRSVIFRHRYCVTRDFLQYMYAVMKEQGTIEWERLQLADLEPGMGPGYGQAKPEGFTYRDADLPKYKDSFLHMLRMKVQKKPRRFPTRASSDVDMEL